MTYRSAKFGFAAAAVLLAAACQTEPPQMAAAPAAPPAAIVVPNAPPASAPTAMDGSWAATDGVFVANFQGGSFTSRFTKTNEILAQGSYQVSGDRVTMNWLSVATQEQRSATCRMTGANSVRCEQGGGGGFDLRRTA
jgi:hypothetical protein